MWGIEPGPSDQACTLTTCHWNQSAEEVIQAICSSKLRENRWIDAAGVDNAFSLAPGRWQKTTVSLWGNVLLKWFTLILCPFQDFNWLAPRELVTSPTARDSFVWAWGGVYFRTIITQIGAFKFWHCMSIGVWVKAWFHLGVQWMWYTMCSRMAFSRLGSNMNRIEHHQCCTMKQGWRPRASHSPLNV